MPRPRLECRPCLVETTPLTLRAAAAIELPLDHLVDRTAYPFGTYSFGQFLPVLDAVELAFQDRGRIETRRERAWREVLETRRELEDLVDHPLHVLNVVHLPIPERVGGNVGAFERILHQVVYFLQA